MDLLFSRFTQLAFGYWHAQPLFVLVERGIFEALSGEGTGADELCRRCEMDPLAGEGLLHAGVALGLLKKRDRRFFHSELSSRFLTAHSPESLVHWIRVMGRWAEAWSRLGVAIRTGAPVESQALRLGKDPRYLEDFILGMHEYAQRTSDDVAAALALDGARRLVDVGGGAGTYSIALCRRHPELHARILDLEPVLPFTRALLQAHTLEQRIDTGVVDYRNDRFGEGFDVVLLSNVLHQESPAVCQSVLARARAALGGGGKVIVHGHFLDEGRTSPTFTTLHNLSAFALWQGGRSYTVSEMMRMVGEAGFIDVASAPIAKAATVAIIGVSAG
jgi:hypothetical protein